jgi:hypothetical protein
LNDDGLRREKRDDLQRCDETEPIYLHHQQGDQMRLRKNVAQPVFCQNYYIPFTVLGCIFHSQICKLPNVSNHPTGENSPNPVTLITNQIKLSIAEKYILVCNQLDSYFKGLFGGRLKTA